MTYLFYIVNIMAADAKYLCQFVNILQYKGVLK